MRIVQHLSQRPRPSRRLGLSVAVASLLVATPALASGLVLPNTDDVFGFFAGGWTDGPTAPLEFHDDLTVDRQDFGWSLTGIGTTFGIEEFEIGSDDGLVDAVRSDGLDSYGSLDIISEADDVFDAYSPTSATLVTHSTGDLQVVGETTTIAALTLEARGEWQVFAAPASERPFARQSLWLTNTGPDAREVTVRRRLDLGASRTNVLIERTSLSDAPAPAGATEDMLWVVASDKLGSRPVMLHLFNGSGVGGFLDAAYELGRGSTDTSTDAVWDTDDDLYQFYDVEIEPGATVGLAWFLVGGYSDGTLADYQTQVAAITDHAITELDDEHLVGLPLVASAPLLNWAVRTSAPGTTAVEPSVACTPSPVTVGTTLTCTVTDGSPGIEKLWRVSADGTPFVSGGVTPDADGAGTFTLDVPASALGRAIDVELVEWRAPVPLGTAVGPVPSAVDTGGGPARSPWPLATLLAMAGMLALGIRRATVPGRG